MGGPDRLGRSAASLLVLGDDPLDDRREGRQLEQRQADADAAEIVGRVAPVDAPAGDGAHLVVELRPADAAAPVAEPDEVDGAWLTLVGGRRFGRLRGVAWVHRWPTLQSRDMPNKSRRPAEWAVRGLVPVGGRHRLRPLGRRSAVEAVNPRTVRPGFEGGLSTIS